MVDSLASLAKNVPEYAIRPRAVDDQRMNSGHSGYTLSPFEATMALAATNVTQASVTLVLSALAASHSLGREA